MNSKIHCERLQNPKISSNIFSRLTFFFTYDVLRKGFKTNIVENDIFSVLPSFKSSKLGNQMEKLCSKSSSSIYGPLWRCYGPYYLFLGLIQLIVKISLILILPKAQGKLISYFTATSQLTKIDAIYYASILIILNFLSTTYFHNYMFWMTELGIKIKTAVSSVIYRKCLKLSQKSLTEHNIGEIVTLISKDVMSFEKVVIFLNDIWISFIILIVASIFLYSKLGVASIAGISIIILIIPLQIYLGKVTSTLRIQAAKATDVRLQISKKILSSIKQIKCNSLVNKFQQELIHARQYEMQKIKLYYFARSVFTELGTFIICITWYCLINAFTQIGKHFTAEIAVFLKECLTALRSPITISIPLGILSCAETKASVDRINKLLAAEEKNKVKNPKSIPLVVFEDVAISIHGLGKLNFKLIPGVNILTGKAGSGKTAIVKAILNEIKIEGNIRICGTMSYASQEPWLFPATIKQNILFGEDFEQRRYKEILKICHLNMDLNTFKAKDETILDDRGRNLSVGQRARINLARALYKQSDIYIIDDCLASLDVQLKEHIFCEAFEKFLQNKLVLLISNNMNFVHRANHAMIIDDRQIETINIQRKTFEDKANEILPTTQNNLLDPLIPLNNKKNIYYEKPNKGKVNLNVYYKYCTLAGGLLTLICILILYGTTQMGLSYSQKSISKWINIQQSLAEFAANSTNSSKYHSLLENNQDLLQIYFLAIIFAIFSLTVRTYTYFNFVARACINLHNKMAHSILNATMNFFDTRYFGNILNRFSKDLYTIDEYLPFNLHEFIKFLGTFLSILILILSVNVQFIIPASVFFIILIGIFFLYIPTGRSIKRLEAATRSPVIGYVNATLDGLTTIRSSQVEDILVKEFDAHQDLNTSAYYMMQSTTRAFAYALDMLCNIFITSVIVWFLISDKSTEPGSVYLAITQSFMLRGILQWGIKQQAEIETNMTSVERILEYSEIETETLSGSDVQNSSASITYKNVSLKYHNAQNKVLNNISFTIKAGEKIGIVGRSGAGKTSLISLLFKLYSYQGSILLNRVCIDNIATKCLRSKIDIIIQDNLLVNGTIRSNLDPNSRYKDEEIWRLIKSIDLENVIPTLDTKTSEVKCKLDGNQKQLISFIRILLNQKRLIILDEAMVNLDYTPKQRILEILISLKKSTLIMVTHDLKAVMSLDKIMVMNNGEIVEFDSPKLLAQNKNGYFYKMLQTCHDHNNLI